MPSNKKNRVTITGAGGFIGHHLVKFLKKKGYWVRGVDIKKPEFEKTFADEFLLLDLRVKRNAMKTTQNIEQVYNLASNMGGIGFIAATKARLLYDNLFIDTNMLEAAYLNKVKRFFYSSSALVYPDFQEAKKNLKLKEPYAYPSLPDSEYGWEKLIAERLCAAYYSDYGLETRVARFHNVYGPLGVYEGGREKSPAAFCRKIAQAKDGDEIEVWGDGKQIRSYCYIDDCLEGIFRLTHSDIHQPINIGMDEPVTINEFINIIAKIAGKEIKKKHDLSKPQGVKIRNSDNTLIRRVLNWEPKIPLKIGIQKTYKWIKTEIDSKKKT